MVELTGRLMMSPEQILEFGRLTDAAQRGDGAVACRLGDMHREGQGGLRYGGACYLHGHGVPADKVEALRLFRLAVEQGEDKATAEVGRLEGTAER